MKTKTIDLARYPTIGEIIFEDEPGTVYINRCALPMFRRYRVTLYISNAGNGRHIIQFPVTHRRQARDGLRAGR